MGPYRLHAVIGAGGMATVYEAEHRDLKKRVALKVLDPALGTQSRHRTRFLREGLASSRLVHPHVVHISDVGEDGDLAYLAMELLHGEPLSSHLGVAHLSPASAIGVLLPIIAALGEAHRRGVTHRDLKPENVFLARTPEGLLVPKLFDFGVSKLVSSTLARLTVQTEIVGTPHYMSPEQARGEASVDAASDQYSLAVMLYQCITGQLPHRGCTSVGEILMEIACGVVMPPSLLVPGLDLGLERVLLRALSPAAADRYPDIESFGLALAPFASARAQASFAALIGSRGGALVATSISLAPPVPCPTAAPAAATRRARDDPPTVPVRTHKAAGRGEP